MEISLSDYGLVPFFTQQLVSGETEQGRVARVTEVQRSLLTLFDGVEERSIPLGSTWLKADSQDRPTVGDWVVLDQSRSMIERVLERKSVFRRIAAGDRTEYQLIAANIDILFIVTSCNEEFNESRLERYLALAAEADVTPVVVFTKIDLADNPDSYVERVRRSHPNLPLELVNAMDESTLTGVKAWIERSSTIALVGSSGVGKSTLLNSLAGKTVAATRAIRDDDKKGRHTTTYRSLFLLPGGGLAIDVPGIRELKVAEIDQALATVFDDIEEMSANCRFKDCRHESEPDCAVREAVANGKLDARRLQNYQKLLRENKRNSASLAEKRSQDRAFAKHVKQVKNLKQDRGDNPGSQT
ncbi:MAG: ribosome small subunit-dependent GTPase A [Gammaproteobacteria bacterium]|nr:ribosome small subunit-dependent GTPase A [Gammaproteobacteria bacterium]